MKALLLSAPSQLDFVDYPDPAPAAGEVMLRIKACGICGSDIHGWDGSSGRRQTPLIMGHEASGEIAALGDGVSGWAVGDRVTFDSMIFCGECAPCQAGQTNLCEHRRVVGVSPGAYKQHGAFAEYLALPARILHRLPDEVTFAQGAMVEPVTIALHAVNRIGSLAGQTALVVGSGMIGLLVIQAARAAGATRVIAVDREESRLEAAAELGATDTIRVGESSDPAAAIAELTAGAGADCAFEVVGIDPTVNLAVNGTRNGGTIVLVGNLAPRVDFPLQAVVTRELSVLGSCGCAGEYPAALEAIANGAIKVGPLISHVAPLEEGADWFARLSGPDGGRHLKVMLQP